MLHRGRGFSSVPDEVQVAENRKKLLDPNEDSQNHHSLGHHRQIQLFDVLYQNHQRALSIFIRRSSLVLVVVPFSWMFSLALAFTFAFALGLAVALPFL